jgi:hypothetical protein
MDVLKRTAIYLVSLGGKYIELLSPFKNAKNRIKASPTCTALWLMPSHILLQKNMKHGKR